MPAFRSRTLTSLALVLALTAGSAAAAAQAAGATRDTSPPTAPAALRTAADSQTTATFAWGASTDNVRVTEYALWAPGRPVVRVPGIVTTAQVTGLLPNTSYAYEVQTWDGWNWSIQPAGTPSSSGNGAWVRRLEPGTTYRIAVRAVDGSGNDSATSNAVTVTTDAGGDTTAPSAPRLLSATGRGTGYCPEELWLGWTASADGAEPASALEYEVRVNGTIVDVATGATNWITYTDVPGANVVTIVAVDRAGNALAASNLITVDVQWGTECPA